MSQPIQLTYRGIAYSSPSQTVETSETVVVAKFRGQHYNVRRPVNVPESQPKVLKYRGVVYTTGNATIEQSKSSQIPTDLVPVFDS